MNSIKDELVNHSVMQKMIQNEIAKAIGSYRGYEKGTVAAPLPNDNVNMVDIPVEEIDESYTGHYAFGVAGEIERHEWIIDTGASTHLCCNSKLMASVIDWTNHKEYFCQTEQHCGCIMQVQLVSMKK